MYHSITKFPQEIVNIDAQSWGITTGISPNLVEISGLRRPHNWRYVEHDFLYGYSSAPTVLKIEKTGFTNFEARLSGIDKQMCGHDQAYPRRNINLLPISLTF